ncbi:metal-dependent hydrolase family protein [Inquilinus sp. OTU3971]|uniref:metal-dependent hydrolase family protein n=1 Tax=Inquilinus sp. OTU3971 TaxID=3043855 RepID=UPI00313E54D9
MGDYHITGAMIWDGSGRDPYPGQVVVRGDRIHAVAPASERLDAGGCETVDGGGTTLMPGLVEGHAHLSFCGAARNTDLGDIPTEEHVLETMWNAELLLDHGFTSCYSAASAKTRLDVVIRDKVNQGRLKGPRIKAASPEITVTGGLGDETRLHLARASFGMVCDGPEEVRRAVRICIREDVDNIKINISGDDFVDPAKGGMSVMSQAEVNAAVEAAHDFGRRVNCHARASEAVKRAIRAGVDVIYHCEQADTEALDMLEAKKDRIFVGPAIGLIYNTIHEAGPWGIDEEKARKLGMHLCLEASQRTYAEMRRRGIRVVIGGDYGFAWTPQGTNARDVEHFVKLFGYTPSEALQCATRIGGELMGMGDRLGQVREGFLADLILVDGDPLKDIALIHDHGAIRMVMKDGAMHRLSPRRAMRAAAE